jgi:Inositol phosphatase
VEEIKEILNQGNFWGPSAEQAKAIQHAVHATKQDERVIKSWVLLAINSKDFEHERIFIVTDKAHYRIKYPH